MPMAENLDPTDWSILVELQTRRPDRADELAAGVNLSASAVTERVRRLEGPG